MRSQCSGKATAEQLMPYIDSVVANLLGKAYMDKHIVVSEHDLLSHV